MPDLILAARDQGRRRSSLERPRSYDVMDDSSVESNGRRDSGRAYPRSGHDLENQRTVAQRPSAAGKYDPVAAPSGASREARSPYGSPTTSSSPYRQPASEQGSPRLRDRWAVSPAAYPRRKEQEQSTQCSGVGPGIDLELERLQAENKEASAWYETRLMEMLAERERERQEAKEREDNLLAELQQWKRRAGGHQSDSSDVRALEAALASERRKSDQLQDDNRALKVQLADQQDRLAKSRERIKSLEEDLSQSEKELAAAERDRRRLRDELATEKGKRDVQQDVIIKLRNIIAAHEEELVGSQAGRKAASKTYMWTSLQREFARVNVRLPTVHRVKRTDRHHSNCSACSQSSERSDASISPLSRDSSAQPRKPARSFRARPLREVRQQKPRRASTPQVAWRLGRTASNLSLNAEPPGLFSARPHSRRASMT